MAKIKYYNSDVVDTGLCFKGYPVLLGARKFSSDSVPQVADSRILTSLDRNLFRYCQSLYEGACDLNDRKILVEGASPWPEGKGPKSIEERAQIRANEFIQNCMAKAGYKPKRWYQFWK